MLHGVVACRKYGGFHALYITVIQLGIWARLVCVALVYIHLCIKHKWKYKIQTQLQAQMQLQIQIHVPIQVCVHALILHSLGSQILLLAI